MLTDDRLRELWMSQRQDVGGVFAFARAVEAEARKQALEEAAQLASDAFEDGDRCAAAIRSLHSGPSS